MALELFLSILSLLLTVYIISFIILLMLENRDPDKTIGWILVVTFLPVIGLFIYFLLGQNWQKKHFIKHFQTKTLRSMLKKREFYTKRTISKIAKKEIDSDLEQKMINNIRRSVGFSLTSRNNAKFFSNGSKKFRALFAELKKAKKYIHLEYYIVKNDQYGEVLRDILIEKALQGIEVKVMLDFYGSFFFLRRNQIKMQKAGVDIHSFFNPLRLLQYHKTNYRNHRKIAIIDGKKAFIGGMNIGEEYATGGKRFSSWKDFHYMVEGEIVHQLQTIFVYDWYLARNESIIKKMYYPGYSKTRLKHNLIQAVYSGPESKDEPIKHTYFLMISNAKESIHITTPYFIPDESVNMALKNAAMSGVDVKIIVPSKSDHFVPIPFHASRTYFEELLEAGVKFYEYKPGFMHAKSIIVDSMVASVGTANLDIRGFQVNFEANIVIYNKSEVEKVEKEFISMISESKEIDLDNFRKRKISLKLKQSIARLFSPIL